jgi:23S rRNA (uracil-5-)-methyltransferase RumA
MSITYQDKVNICDHYDLCGGCSSLDVEYEKQIEAKKQKVKQFYLDNDIMEFPLSEVIKSPDIYEYRNHMELSFGDLEIGGKLQLGLHPRGKRYEVVTIDGCFLIDEDFRKIIRTMIDYFRNTDLKKYHIKRREGFLRNVKLRKGVNTGEILINLITNSKRSPDLSDLVAEIRSLNFKDELVGFLHTINDDFADAVKADQVNTLYGRDHFYEKLLDYEFKISPLDFFQVNTKAAEKLYEVVIEHVKNSNEQKVYDLYSGTGSIAQVISPHVEEVIGIELDESAVQQARENLKLNNISNCNFIQGDVREVLKQEKKPVNKVVVDPPRPGLHSEVTRSIVDIAPEEIIYVSCNPKTQAQDLKKLLYNNYHIEDIKLVDMFPHTNHIESVAFIKKD